MFKKIVSLMLVLSLVFASTLSANAMHGHKTYDDTGEFLKAIGLIKGDAEGNLNSMDTITREESIIVILRMLELEKEAMETKDGEKSFNDIPNGSYFAPYIAFAKEKGITNGVGGGSFGYGKNVTVKELLTMFLRATGYSANWATENIWEKSVKYGLTKKLDKSDNDTALRGDAFIIFDNAIRLPYNPEVKPKTCLLNTLITKIHILGENEELFEKYPELVDYVAQKYTPDYSFLDEMNEQEDMEGALAFIKASTSSNNIIKLEFNKSLKADTGKEGFRVMNVTGDYKGLSEQFYYDDKNMHLTIDGKHAYISYKNGDKDVDLTGLNITICYNVEAMDGKSVVKERVIVRFPNE